MKSSHGRFFHALVLRSCAGTFGACLLGCAAHFAPIKPLEKGEFQQGIGLQLMPGSLINYGASYGLAENLEVGMQAGLFNAGARARLHAPIGQASSVSLTNGFLAFRDFDEEKHAHLRWEGRLGYIHASPWFQYAFGPMMQVETVVPDHVRYWNDRYAPKAGAFVAFGTPRMAWEFDWNMNYAAESELSNEAGADPGDHEVAVKISWFWGDRVPKAEPEDPFAESAPAPAAAAATPPAPLVPVDEATRFGAILCRASQADFRAWSSRSPFNRSLAEAALASNRGRMRQSKISAGCGAAAMLLGGGIFLGGLLANVGAEYRDGMIDDDTIPVPVRIQADNPRLEKAGGPGTGGMIIGSGLLAVGAWFTGKGIYHAIARSEEERELIEAYADRLHH